MENQLIKRLVENQGLTVLPDTKTWINRFEIESESSNRVYTIAQRANLSEWGCSCMGWKRYRKCKHLQTIMPLLNDINRAATTEKKQDTTTVKTLSYYGK